VEHRIKQIHLTPLKLILNRHLKNI